MTHVFKFLMGEKTWILKICENYHKHIIGPNKEKTEALYSTCKNMPKEIGNLIFSYLPKLSIEEISSIE